MPQHLSSTHYPREPDASASRHALQAMTDLDPEPTILSIDVISPYVSRRAILSGLSRVESGSQALPFVTLLYGGPSKYWREDDKGIVHEVDQGEGGEQGDAMMPLLFSVEQPTHCWMFRTGCCRVKSSSLSWKTYTRCVVWSGLEWCILCWKTH